ncbi:hypothetical protein L873DRAFT_363736 [Choiromyces venosus 120613-1]|uniref:Uncharacterized protein n=1 Tax=Choiromyces venosus 120613-1 TaxID=1336337 RepID=A0A3N4K9U0_9PEZI|nr:hypothetical protein L873DRAFT_363736 [Choiromyces venosus 120613-1]
MGTMDKYKVTGVWFWVLQVLWKMVWMGLVVGGNCPVTFPGTECTSFFFYWLSYSTGVRLEKYKIFLS